MEAPLILAIETSGKTGGIALFKGSLLSSVSLSSQESYSKVIFKTLTFITEVLKFSLEEVDYYAIDIGPGSFTGLRIGLSVLKGLNLVYPKPVIPLCSLEILATNFINHSLPLVSLVNAYSKEVFLAIYQWEDFKLNTKLTPCCISLKEISNYINEPAIFLSETLEIWDEFFKKELKNFYIKPEIPVNISAELVAKLAYLKIKQDKVEFKDAETLLPFYLKSSEAERKKGIKIV